MKYNWGLDSISSLTKTVSVVNRPQALFLRLFDADQNLIVLRTLMLKEVVLQERLRQVNQGAGWGQFESAVCLSFPIPLAKEFS